MDVNKPIIIVGTGRCGSTMLHRLMALHGDVGWLSPFNEVLPTQPWLSVFSNLYRLPFLGHKVRHLRFFPKPFEAYRFWEHYLPGFSRRNRPLTAEDVPAEAIEPVRRVAAQVLKFQQRPRLLVKVTGWSRIDYFNRLFPDALFVFLNREPRSVVSSWIKAGWLDVTSSADSDTWQWGDVPPAYYRLWQELGGGPVLSAALKIKMDLDDIQHNASRIPARCYTLQYESLITQPVPELQKLLAFCQLPWTGQFERVVEGMTFHNPLDKWKKYLPPEEGERIVAFFDRAEALHPGELWPMEGAV